MDKYLYDAKTNAFYPLDMESAYKDAEMWPDSGVLVNEDVFASFQNPPYGKIRAANKNGYPEWVDIPPLSNDELTVLANSYKQSLITKANEYISIKQWPGKAAIGRLSDSDRIDYNIWLDYLDALDLVDTSKAPDIKWPLEPNK